MRLSHPVSSTQTNMSLRNRKTWDMCCNLSNLFPIPVKGSAYSRWGYSYRTDHLFLNRVKDTTPSLVGRVEHAHLKSIDVLHSIYLLGSDNRNIKSLSYPKSSSIWYTTLHLRSLSYMLFSFWFIMTDLKFNLFER